MNFNLVETVELIFYLDFNLMRTIEFFFYFLYGSNYLNPLACPPSLLAATVNPALLDPIPGGKVMLLNVYINLLL